MMEFEFNIAVICLRGQETEHVKTGHVKLGFVYISVCTVEFPASTVMGVFVVRFTFMGISVVIFAYTPVRILREHFRETHRQDKASAEIRGVIFWPNFRFEFSGDFFDAFVGEKKVGKIIHPKLHSKIQITIWELSSPNPPCKDLASVHVICAFLIERRYTPRVCKPWFSNHGWRFLTKQRWK